MVWHNQVFFSEKDIMFIEKKILSLIRPSIDSEDPLKDKHITVQVLMYLFDALIIIIALVVAWDCNSRVNLLIRLIVVIYAGLFPSFYLTFYFFYRIILGNPCY
jgi:hypothetical protein